ncbi:MAG: glycosyltransferase [Nitrospirales bacterium]
MSDIIRVFVAGTPSEWLAMRVLEFSIRETTNLPLEFSALYSFDRPIPRPQAKKNWPRTPFSFQRFLIPELCSYEGKAIYLDADMLVFRDIAELWNQPLNDCDLQAIKEPRQGLSSQFSVMLLECARLHWNIEEIISALDSGELEYVQLMREMCIVDQIGWDIRPDWNSLEQYKSDETALLHYTNMPTQPWVASANPLGPIWVGFLRRALDAGFISQKELEREVTVGHVRPSLQVEVEQGCDQVGTSPFRLRHMDRDFIPPYERLRLGKPRIFPSIRRLFGGIFR